MQTSPVAVASLLPCQAARPNRIFNIEWRVVYFADHTQTANFEVRLYENDPNKRFDFIFGTVQPGSDQLYVSGVQGAAGAFTQDFCDANPPAPGSRTIHVPWRGYADATHANGYADDHAQRDSNVHADSDAKCTVRVLRQQRRQE